MVRLYAILALGFLMLFCFAERLVAQQIDSRLWGTWELQSTKQTTLQNAKKLITKSFSQEDILNQKTDVPEDLFLLLYMFENNIGVSSTDGDINYLQINDKGTFFTDNEQLVISLNRDDRPFLFYFTYQVNGDELNLSIDIQSKKDSSIKYRRSLTYKLTGKN